MSGGAVYAEASVKRAGWWALLGFGLLCLLVLVPLMERLGLWHILLLKDYNTRLVVLSTTLMGTACGVVGSYLLLRRRSLMGDALSHATLPGVAVAFLVLVALGGDGKDLGWLLCGAAVTGLLGALLVTTLTRLPRIKEDTAMGIILSVFYGFGVVLLSLIQEMPRGSAAGLSSFIYGKTASLVLTDFVIIFGIALVSLVICLALFKEFKALCFDEAFSASLGLPVTFLDRLLLTLVCAVTVSGLQAVGLILIIAFLIIPAAAARMWSARLEHMLLISAMMGAFSGWMGSTLSATLPRMPAGAVIVLVASGLFLFSLCFGINRGLLVRYLRHGRLKRRIERQHLLRAAYEILEARAGSTGRERFIAWPELLARRSWSPGQLWRIARRASDADIVERLDSRGLSLSPEGLAAAARVTRNHRLWELYLIEFADIAPNHVDRDADSVEHVLGQRLTRQLEQSLPEHLRGGVHEVPTSPHRL
jgi:manganese/zinc/iron transport system permease protein